MSEHADEMDWIDAGLLNVTVRALEGAEKVIRDYAELRAITACQRWFNPLAEARAQGRLAGLDQAADIVARLRDEIASPPGATS